MITTIQFTQEQARTLTGLSTETLRHWRKVVPYLQAKSGKSARFAFSDLIALAIGRELIAHFGVHIASIGGGMDALFRALADTRAALREGSVAILSPTEASIHCLEELPTVPLAAPMLVVPCDPLIHRMRQHMMPVVQRNDQPTLPFPPLVIRSGR
ncbi:MAG: hypothetical protein ACREC6_00240 [Hyphomicrobiaceae bacterium]